MKKNQIKLFLATGFCSIMTASGVALADPCSDLQSQLSSCQAKITSDQNEIQQISALNSNIANLSNQLGSLQQIQNSAIPACQNQTAVLNNQMGQMQAAVQQANNDLNHAKGDHWQIDQRFHQRLAKWVCAIKDRKYANVGYGEGPDMGTAKNNAIAQGQIGKQVNEMGSYDFCFPVFHN